MKVARECRECYAPFEGESWQRLCWRCWRERKERETQQKTRTDAYWDGFYAGLARGKPDYGQLDRGLLADAIALCHPDRHPAERCELATTTTAALLELRGALAA